LLLPAVQTAREAARRMQCANNFKQVGLAVHSYISSKGFLPPGEFLGNYCGVPGTTYGMGWLVFTLPYLDQSAVYDHFDFRMQYYDPPNSDMQAGGATIPAYLCPSDSQADPLVNFTGSINRPGRNPLEDLGRTNIVGMSDSINSSCPPTYYAPRMDADGVFMNYRIIRIEEITDGTSNTLLAGEVTGGMTGSFTGKNWIISAIADFSQGINGAYSMPGDGTPFTWPASTGGPHSGFSSYHSGGCNFAVADGSCCFLSQDTDQKVLAALATRAGVDSLGAADKVILSGPP
jgi:hypothetical protein